MVAMDVAKLSAGAPDRLAESLGIMERQIAADPAARRRAARLCRGSRRARSTLSREPVEVARLVEAALEAIRPLLVERDHQLHVELPPGRVQVLGDAARLIQVLTNLLSNAAKYTPPGGHLELRFQADRPRARVVVRVRDDGKGIPEDMLGQIFEIFVQSRDDAGRARGGLGIGLNLVRRLVELHGGTVSATSEGVGRGSEFVVELPLETSPEQAT